MCVIASFFFRSGGARIGVRGSRTPGRIKNPGFRVKPGMTRGWLFSVFSGCHSAQAGIQTWKVSRFLLLAPGKVVAGFSLRLLSFSSVPGFVNCKR